MNDTLELRSIDLQYGAVKALKNISIKVFSGQVVLLLGANGAGKSSTLKTVAGLANIRNGSVLLNSEEITRKSPNWRVKRGIVYCPEGRQIFPRLSVEENLRIGAFTKPDKEHVSECMQLVYNYFPILEQRRNQKGETLSGGEQQMLAIGRALMSKPKMILLDEPSLGLAPLIIKDIFNIIARIKEDGVTVVLVEQNAALSLEVADYCYVLGNGEVKAQGTPDAIKKDHELRQIYLGGE